MTARQANDVIGGDGLVRILAHRCGTCLFRHGHPFGDDRAAEVIQANLAADALLTCHSTLPYGEHPEFGPAVCAGFWARHSRDVLAGRLAWLIGIIRIVPPGES